MAAESRGDTVQSCAETHLRSEMFRRVQANIITGSDGLFTGPARKSCRGWVKDEYEDTTDIACRCVRDAYGRYRGCRAFTTSGIVDFRRMAASGARLAACTRCRPRLRRARRDRTYIRFHHVVSSWRSVRHFRHADHLTSAAGQWSRKMVDGASAGGMCRPAYSSQLDQGRTSPLLLFRLSSAKNSVSMPRRGGYSTDYANDCRQHGTQTSGSR